MNSPAPLCWCWACTCTYVPAALPVVRKCSVTPLLLASFLVRRKQATPCSDRQCFYCLYFPLPCFLVGSLVIQRASSAGCWFRDPPCALPRKRRRQTSRVAAQLDCYTKVKCQPVSSQPACQPAFFSFDLTLRQHQPRAIPYLATVDGPLP